MVNLVPSDIGAFMPPKDWVPGVAEANAQALLDKSPAERVAKLSTFPPEVREATLQEMAKIEGRNAALSAAREAARKAPAFLAGVTLNPEEVNQLTEADLPKSRVNITRQPDGSLVVAVDNQGESEKDVIVRFDTDGRGRTRSIIEIDGKAISMGGWSRAQQIINSADAYLKGVDVDPAAIGEIVNRAVRPIIDSQVSR